VIRQTIAVLVALAMCSVATNAQSAKGNAPPATNPAQTQSLNLTAYAELLRSDVRAQKVAIITEVMGFTETEDKAFWPIYRQYDAEMSKLGDERVALITEYAQSYETMTDAVADKLAAKAIDLEARRRTVTANCYDQVKKALSPKTAFRFLQVEHQLQLLIDLQIAASLPIASK
jgi:hypothetical protein